MRRTTAIIAAALFMSAAPVASATAYTCNDRVNEIYGKLHRDHNLDLMLSLHDELTGYNYLILTEDPNASWQMLRVDLKTCKITFFMGDTHTDLTVIQGRVREVENRNRVREND